MSPSLRLLPDYNRDENFLPNSPFKQQLKVHQYCMSFSSPKFISNLLSCQKEWRIESNGFKVRCRLTIDGSGQKRGQKTKFKDENLWRQTISPAGFCRSNTFVFRWAADEKSKVIGSRAECVHLKHSTAKRP